MKPVTVIGIIVILLGLAGFFVRGVSFSEEETKAQIGNLKITAEHQRHYFIPPWAAGVIVLVGLGVTVYGIMKRR